ncbi:MAG: aspartate kinase [Phycisphaerales bacterium]|nr:aspartate kinase [Phycisphaerales bacterium]
MKRATQPQIAIHKFGGKALADSHAILRAVDLIDGMSGARVIVVSALEGVTDALLSCARLAGGGDLSASLAEADSLRRRHLRTIDELAPEDAAARGSVESSFAQLDGLLGSVAASRELRPCDTDAIASHGERLCARIVGATLLRFASDASIIDPSEFLLTDGRYGDAAPDFVSSEPLAKPLFEAAFARSELVVVPGFIGVAPDGSTVTLGRGGSDLTATTLARLLGAAEVTLWKDVPGFLTADPRIEPDARVVTQLDPREASELAYYGAKVLHPRALTPLTAQTVLRIRPFAQPDAEGTAIAIGRTAGGSPVRAISAISPQALVTVAGNGMLGVPGIAARTFDALGRAGISVSLISQASSEHSICFTVPEHAAATAQASLRAAFASELARGEIDAVEVQLAVATVAVVGAGMARTPGTAARVLGAIAEAKVNVIAIAQGSSERNISFVIEASAVPGAVRAIHSAFRLAKVGGGRAPRAEGADIILLGCGQIGRELIAQVEALPASDRRRVRIVAVIDRTGWMYQSRGISRRRLAAVVACKRKGRSVASISGGHEGTPLDAVRHIATHALTRPVLVDVSSGDTRETLSSAIGHGMDLVLANKVPLACDGASARSLLRDARANGRRVLHEATVGAGLPVIDTIAKLVASGDKMTSVLACPSGTLGFLFSELGRGRTFSDALRKAMKLGYTEPDPREDLSGADVARKAIILARLIGYEGELEDIAVESLVPLAMREIPVAKFVARSHELDLDWRARVDEAASRGEVLRYCAQVTRASVKVGLVGAPIGSSLSSLSGTDNLFAFSSSRYRTNALVVSGPGAGPEVTAAGVLSDILRVVEA